MFWLTLFAAACLGGVWMAAPFLRTRVADAGDADGAISVYRDQIDEIERDRVAGLISAAECDAARAEIERRALHAARSLDQGLAVSRRAPLAAGLVAAGTAAAALAIYAPLGAPGSPDQPLAARKVEELTRRADAGDIGSRIQLLIENTQDNPESFEDWWMLARSYAAMGDHVSSADAYRHAVELAGDRPAVLSAYAEAMTLANGNKVPGAARLIFEGLARGGDDPRARYYLALAKAQAQDFQGAIDDWAALARASDPSAPWMALVRRDITNMARFLEQDVTDYLPDARPEEIASAGGAGLLPETAADQIAGLEDALAKEPKDYKSWIALAEARAQSGDSGGAAAALAEGRRHYAAAPFVMQKFSEAERKLGLDLLAAPRGPTTEDMAAAAEMSQQERDDMIAGMVSGLAARLEEEPEDPAGWVMLIRSYATLNEPEKAREALARAQEIFANRTKLLIQISKQTEGILSSN